jgi:Na+/proline symporter
LLGAAVFLLQRGIGAGITIYAPAIVLSTVMGWRLDATIICSGLVVIAYTTLGGTDAVNVTQKQQIAVIFAGMFAAVVVLWTKLPSRLTLSDTLTLAGGFHKLKAVDYSFNLNNRYTFCSGILAATFLMLAYFGTDQSQVQRYLSGTSLREGRLGLMFNAVCKIPMQFGILLLGVLIFVFYQFEQPPLFFNASSRQYFSDHGSDPQLQAYERDFDSAHARKSRQLEDWLKARHDGNRPAASAALSAAFLRK